MHRFNQVCGFLLASLCGLQLAAQNTSFVYITDDSGIRGYFANPDSGTLTPIAGSPFTGPRGGDGLTIAPNQRFLYEDDPVTSTVAAYLIDSSTGALSPMAGSPFSVGKVPESPVVDPTGRFLYVTCTTAFVVGFSIDSQTGALTPLPGSPFAVPGLSTTVLAAIDPQGKVLYVGDSGTGKIGALGIDSATGVLAPIAGSPFSGGVNLGWIGVHPSGKFLYVDDFGFGSGSTFGYAIDASTGALTPIPGQVAVSDGPHASTFDVNGRFIYIAGEYTNGILAYSVNQTTGSLTIVSGSPFPGGFFPISLAIDPTSTFLYAPNDQNSNVSAYTINLSTGVLTQVPGSPFLASSNPLWVATVRGGGVPVTVSPNRGGNAGTVTVSITGSGFQSDASVKLTGLGADIVGANTTVPNSFFLTTTFDLTTAAVGTHDVVITNPDNTTTSLTDGFTVQQGGAPQVSVQIIGRSQIRAGANQTYDISIQNTGLVDASVVALNLLGSSPSLIPATSGNSASPSPLYFGSLPALSNINVNVSIVSPPAGQCPILTGGAFTLPTSISSSNVGPSLCDWFLAFKAEGEAFENIQYGLRLANLLAWIHDVLPINKGGTGRCFNPNDKSTEDSCDEYESEDDGYSESIERAEATKRALCISAALLNLDCPLQCDEVEPADIIDLDSYNQTLRKILNKVKIDFEAATIAQADQEVQSLYQQVMGLSKSLTFANALTGPQLDALPASGSTELQICSVGSLDPNFKSGPNGVGASRFISGDIAVPYLISFENKPSATAPAQSVSISDTLSSTLVNFSSIFLGPISLPNLVITPPFIPLSAKPFSTTVDLRPNTNLLVNITASLDTLAGILTWNFKSVDPATGLPPVEPQAGFLPPGSDGSVFFTAFPQSTITTGTVLPNAATVTFDVNVPINTPTWSNTIDNTPPVSHVDLLSSQSGSVFTVQWSGSDVGSGLQNFAIYVSDNNGPFAPWLTQATGTSGIYNGPLLSGYKSNRII